MSRSEEVESVKQPAILYSPVDGEIVEVNDSLPDNLDTLSSDPYGAGWIIKVKLSSDGALAELLNLKRIKSWGDGDQGAGFRVQDLIITLIPDA